MRLIFLLLPAMLLLGLPYLANAATDATPTQPLKSGYPLNLIYGGGNLNAMGCPKEKQPECLIELADYLSDLGIRSTRKTLSWFHTAPERGKYDWTQADNVFPHLKKHGFTTVALVSDTPAWASHPDLRRILDEENNGRFYVCLPNMPETWPDYEAWLGEAVQRYGADIDYYEIWNEPDGMCGIFPKYWEGRIGGYGVGGDPEWYSELLKRSSKVIREKDPGAKVSVGGFECKGGLQTDFVEGIYQRGCQPFFDAVSIHPYADGYGQPFHRKWLATVRGVMAKYGDAEKPMWITEYNNEGHNELDMSFTVRRKHRLMRETPWLTIAIPLGTQYMYYGKDAANWPLRAIKQMEASEFEARKEWKQDFEGPASSLLANWEWRALPEPWNDPNWPDMTFAPEEGNKFSTGLKVQCKDQNKRIRICFLPYVRTEDPVFELTYKYIPQKEGSRAEIRVGEECLDILEDERISDVIASATAAPLFKTITFKPDETWPDWKNKGINMIYAEFASEDPGFTVIVDDVKVYGSSVAKP